MFSQFLLAMLGILALESPTVELSIHIEAHSKMHNAHGAMQEFSGAIRTQAHVSRRDTALSIALLNTETMPSFGTAYIPQPALSNIELLMHEVQPLPLRMSTSQVSSADAQTNAALIQTAVQSHFARVGDRQTVIVDTTNILGLNIVSTDTVRPLAREQIDTLQGTYTAISWQLRTGASRVLLDSAQQKLPATLNIDLVRSINGRTLFNAAGIPTFTQLSGTENWNMSFVKADGSTMDGATATTKYTMNIEQLPHPDED